jgi:hypothetical protein
MFESNSLSKELAATVRIQGATLAAVFGENEFPAEEDTTIPFLNAWKAPTEVALSK